jgi:hypothetical protein
MRQVIVMCLLSSVLATAQLDHVYFKLDEGTGTSTLNYGTAGEPLGYLIKQGGGPATQPFAWGAGAQGAGSMGVNASIPPTSSNLVRLDTRYYFSLGPAEPFTLAFFMKPVWPYNLLNSDYFISSGSGNHIEARIAPAQNGASGYVIQVSSATGGGSGGGGSATIDYTQLTLGQWYHVAFVIERYGNNGGTGLMRPYLNGVPLAPAAVSGMHDFNTSSMTVTIGNAGIAFDEIRISKRIVPASEIALWASTASVPFAAQRVWNNGCTPVGQFNGILNVAGDMPTLGNASYSLDLFAPYASSVLLVAGLGRQNPLNLGPLTDPQLNNCLMQPTPEFLFPTMTMPPSGHTSLSAPIASDPLLAGMEIHLQAVGYNPWNAKWFSTNTFSAYIGY